MAIDLSKIVLIDHHAHSLLGDFSQLDELGLRQAFSESRSMTILSEHMQNSLSYMHMLGELSALLDLTGYGSARAIELDSKSALAQDNSLRLSDSTRPVGNLRAADEAAVVDMRSQIRADEYAQMLFDDASIGAFIIDDGFDQDRMLDLKRFGEFAERPVYRCLRIESVLERQIVSSESFDQLKHGFHHALGQKGPARTVALKTIAAYRGGLALELIREEEARSDFDRCKNEVGANNGALRISRRPLYHYFLGEAFEFASEHGWPVQIHAGLGDSDQDLRQANPLCWKPILDCRRFSKTKFVFLHTYPFVRETALLTALYPNAYIDLSLASFQVSAMLPIMFQEALSAAPFSKILAATDGHSVPETYWYASRSLRNGLGKALDRLVQDEFVSEGEAMEMAAAIFYGNARNIYALEP